MEYPDAIAIFNKLVKKLNKKILLIRKEIKEGKDDFSKRKDTDGGGGAGGGHNGDEERDEEGSGDEDEDEEGEGDRGETSNTGSPNPASNTTSPDGAMRNFSDTPSLSIVNNDENKVLVNDENKCLPRIPSLKTTPLHSSSSTPITTPRIFNNLMTSTPRLSKFQSNSIDATGRETPITTPRISRQSSVDKNNMMNILAEHLSSDGAVVTIKRNSSQIA